MIYEAKADGSREAVRMAVGQLLNYRRLHIAAGELVQGLAVLLPRSPTADTRQLFRSVEIGLVWQSRDEFVTMT